MNTSVLCSTETQKTNKIQIKMRNKKKFCELDRENAHIITTSEMSIAMRRRKLPMEENEICLGK